MEERWNAAAGNIRDSAVSRPSEGRKRLGDWTLDVATRKAGGGWVALLTQTDSLCLAFPCLLHAPAFLFLGSCRRCPVIAMCSS